MTPQEIIDFGITLRTAYDKYARAGKIKERPQNISPPPQIQHSPDSIALHHAISDIGDAVWEWTATSSSKRENFIAQLLSEKLIAAGFVSPRGPADRPKIIPADIWELAEIEFAKSEISSGSLKFEGVRIVKPRRKKKIPANNNKSELPITRPKPVGRPSSRERIFAAYQELKSENKIDFSKPMTHAYRVIRSRLFYKYKTEKGFQSEAIRLAIRDDFQAEANKLKFARKL